MEPGWGKVMSRVSKFQVNEHPLDGVRAEKVKNSESPGSIL
jgi:hypothetical protein